MPSLNSFLSKRTLVDRFFAFSVKLGGEEESNCVKSILLNNYIYLKTIITTKMSAANLTTALVQSICTTLANKAKYCALYARKNKKLG
jgi:hypothetical protein